MTNWIAFTSYYVGLNYYEYNENKYKKNYIYHMSTNCV